MAQNTYFLLLKQQVLICSGIQNILPGDCKTLAKEIFNKTNFSLSETTLKRVYGFALAKFEASMFTKNALACFCGYAGWKEYIQKAQSLENQNDQSDLNWEHTRSNSHRVALIVLQSIRKRLSIPGKKTVRRPTLKDYLQSFEASGCQAALICTSVGKEDLSVMLEQLEYQMEDASNKNIYLLMPSEVLKPDIRCWLSLYASVLQITGLRYTDENRPLFTGEVEHCFYLIIEYPEDYYNDQEEFSALVEQLNTICQLHLRCNWFKLILLTRIDSWTMQKFTLEPGQVKWFLGGVSEKLN